MAVNLGSLLISLGLDSGEFKSGLSVAEKEFRSSARRIEKIGDSLQNVGRNMTVGITAPIAAMGIAAFKAASDAQEMESAFEATFGSMAASVRKWAEETGDAMGRSTQEMMSMAMSFQGILKNQMDPAAAAEMSKQMAVLTQDLASFKNLSNEVAQQKIFSGLIGEAEPLRAVGVLLSATAVDAKVLQMGLAGTKKEISDGMRVQARAALIMEQLADAQGDVIRTSSSAANQLKATRAQFEEMQVSIGQKLLPALTPLIGHITRLLEGFNKLSPGVQQSIIHFAAFAAALGPIVFVAGTLGKLFGPFAASVRAAGVASAAAGVQTTAFGVALAGLRIRLLALVATLGPWAIGIAAVTGAYMLASRMIGGTTKAVDRYTEAERKSAGEKKQAAALLDQIATATGKARQEILALARAKREDTLQSLANAKAAMTMARINLMLAKSKYQQLQSEAAGAAMYGGEGGAIVAGSLRGQGEQEVRQGAADLKSAAAAVQNLAETLESVNKVINSSEPPPVVAVTAGDEKKKSTKEPKGPTGPSASEIERRFTDEMIGYTQQSLSSLQQLATSSQERAELQLRSVEWSRIQTLAQIKADEDYNAAQKAELSAAVERIATNEREIVERQLALDLEQERNELAQIAFDDQRELMMLSAEMADTQADRKRIAFDILALEQEYRRNQLEMVVSSKLASDAERARAQAILSSLGAIEAGERASVGRRNETEVEAYLRDLNKSPEQINEAMDGIRIDGLERLNDGLVQAIMGVKSLGSVFKDVAGQILADLLKIQLRKAIIGPLANALFPGRGGPVDLLAGTPFGGGRAKGGSISAGTAYLVGEKGPEIVVPGRSGTVIPNGALAGMGGGNITVNVNAKDAVLTSTVAGWVQQGIGAAIGGADALQAKRKKWSLA